MVLNATFNNFSVISWRTVSLLKELEYPGIATNLPHVTGIEIGKFKLVA